MKLALDPTATARRQIAALISPKTRRIAIRAMMNRKGLRLAELYEIWHEDLLVEEEPFLALAQELYDLPAQILMLLREHFSRNLSVNDAFLFIEPLLIQFERKLDEADSVVADLRRVEQLSWLPSLT